MFSQINLICVVLLTAVVVLPTAHSLDSSQNFAKISQFFYQKCTQAGATEAYENLSRDAQHLYDFLTYTFGLMPDRKKEFCEAEKKSMSQKMQAVLQDLKPCLNSQEKYLPEYLQSSFDEFLKFLCENHAENMMKFFGADSTLCRDRLDSNEVANCFSRIFAPQNGVLKKEEMCEDYNVARKCFAQILDQSCSSRNELKDLNTKFFDYIRKPCSGCAFLANKVLLGLSLIFVAFRTKLF